MDINKSVDSLIDELEDVLESSWQLPLTGGKCIIDSEELKRIIEDMRLRLPQEIRQAKNIVSDRSDIINDAKKEADAIVKSTEEKVKILASQSEVLRQAQTKAREILEEAESRAKEMRTAANEYVDSLMKDTDHVLTSGISEIRKARQSLKVSNKN